MSIRNSTKIRENEPVAKDEAWIPRVISTATLVNEEEKATDKDEEPTQKELGIVGSTFNLLNTIIGGGIIALPNALKSSGLPAGLILLVLVAILSDYSIPLLIKSGKFSNKFTYQDVAKASLGITGIIVVSLCQFLTPFGAMIAYSVAIGDNFTNVFSFLLDEGHVLRNRRIIITIATFAVMFPLSCFRNIAFLEKFSTLSIICVFFYIAVVITRVFTLQGFTYWSPNMWEFARPGVAQSIGTIAFALSCQPGIFLMYRVLKRASVKRYGRVAHYAVSISVVLYALVAVCGYITFSDQMTGNVMKSYCNDDKLVIAARIIFSLTVMLTYPMQCFVAREVVDVGLFSRFAPSWFKHLAITIVLSGISFGIAMATDQLGLVIEVSGCLSASPLVFILPPLMYMRLSPTGLHPFRGFNIVNWIVVLIGFAVMIIGTVMSFLDHPVLISEVRYWCNYKNGTQ